jgi:predicted nucleic acid-binding protein
LATFLDTSAIYALLDERDPVHHLADQAFRFLVEADELVTTNYVALEASALMQRRFGFDAARDLHVRFLPLVDVEWIDAALHRTAVTSLLAAGNRNVSLVDWSSFVFMRERGIDDVFTFDRDFAAQGFNVVPSPPAPDPAAIST